jgi:ferredoxin
MNTLKFILFNIIATLLRLFPLPCKTGIITIGNPDRRSPVLLTGNYIITVLRVKRAIEGNAYLLVANSRGINVWCAGGGGHFTNHDVISVLKTSGIEKEVDHREVILPQLAAVGVEATTIKRKTGWRVIWGPVYAKDIPAFIKNNRQKTSEMREVQFPLTQRIEMAVAWAFPISIISALVMMILWQDAVIPIIIIVWGMSLSIFLSFPLYDRWLNAKRGGDSFVTYDFGKGGIQLLFWVISMLVLVIWSILTGDFSWGFIIRWGVILTIIGLILSIDLMGSTPLHKSGFHEDRVLEIIIDAERCKGVAACEAVCPRNCYDIDKVRHTATIPRAERCVHCGACIVQCPLDALSFKSPKGETIPPATIRKYKLNLMGKRIDST